MQVHIKIENGKTLSLDVQPSDSISMLKDSIKKQTGIDPTKQRIMLAGKELKDGWILAESNIPDNLTLNLVLKQANMLIFIKNTLAQTFTLVVDQYETIEEVKAKIAEKKGVAIDRLRLFTHLGPLEDSGTLASYNISDESIVVLMQKSAPLQPRVIL